MSDRTTIPMVSMSRAIRTTCEEYSEGPGGTIGSIGQEALDEFIVIIRAFLHDLEQEAARRNGG